MTHRHRQRYPSEAEWQLRKYWLPILRDAAKNKKQEEFLRIWGSFGNVELEKIPPDERKLQLDGVKLLRENGYDATCSHRVEEPSSGVTFTALDILVRLPEPAQKK